MEYEPEKTPTTILCCMCGTPIAPNQANACVNCIQSRVDITEGIPKQVHISMCKSCGRYQQPPTAWVHAELESPELLTVCLKRIKGLGTKCRLVDAGFVWTEPHSRRLSVKLTVQKEVFSGAILQQAFLIEFVVNTTMCDDCHRTEAQITWTAVAQVRQRVSHKRTFYWLEQLILRHGAHQHTMAVKETADGLDFYFSQPAKCKRLLEFLGGVVPLRFSLSKKLMSFDEQNARAAYKHNYSAEIATVCKDDLCCLPLRTARAHGNISPLVVCYKVTSMLHFVDPITLQRADVVAANFWREPFRAIAHSRQLIPYTVLDVTLTGASAGKFALADVELARSSDLGQNDTILLARTHLGRVLQPGDTCLGYDVASANFNDADLKPMRGASLPDVVLVRKAYPERRSQSRFRLWKLKRLAMNTDPDKPAASSSSRDRGNAAQLAGAQARNAAAASSASSRKKKGRKARAGGSGAKADEPSAGASAFSAAASSGVNLFASDKAMDDYEEFLRDLEEDPDARAEINLYKDRRALDDIRQRYGGRLDVAQAAGALPASGSSAASFTKGGEDGGDGGGGNLNDDGFPDVQLAELLDDLSLRSDYGGDSDDDEDSDGNDKPAADQTHDSTDPDGVPLGQDPNNPYAALAGDFSAKIIK